MYLQQNNLFLVAVVATAIGSWASSVLAASEYVVVAVDPPVDIPPLGKLYKLGDLLHIDRGSTVTLMGDDGSVSAVPGPADIVVTDSASEAGSTSSESADGSSRLTAISDLLAKAGGQVQSIGASRGVSAMTPTGLEPWSIPVEDGVTGCIHDRKLELWREPGGRAAVSIGYDDQPIVVGLVWDAGSPKLTIPGSVPGEAESVVVRIDDQSSRLTLKHLPSGVSPQDHVGLYAWMVGSACLLQASALIRELASQGVRR